MMDLSDGLQKDLPRLVRMSEVGAEIWEEKIPRNEGVSVAEALGDGEDYELLFTSAAEIEEAWREVFPQLELTRIGQLTELGEGSLNLQEGGWDHFLRS